MIIITVVIWILTLGFTLNKLSGFTIKPDNVIQTIFALAPHSFSYMTAGFWSILAALITGGYIGGLVVRTPKKGIQVGLISFGLLMFFQLAIGFLFDITTYQGWLAQVSSDGGDIIIDFVLSAVLLMAAGTVGGIVTKE
jgi:hypothetical protein